MKAFALAVAAVAAAFAGPVAAGSPDAPQATVRYSDLDLSSTAGRAAFDRRMRSAIRQVCGVGDRPELVHILSARACVVTTSAKVASQVQTALAGAREAAL